MKRLILIIYVTLVVVLAVATFVEQARGTAYIGEQVYGSAWFCALWGVLAVLTVVACTRVRLWRRVPLLLLHGSFLVILGGAFLTFVWGEQGYVHLEEGQATDRFMVRDSGELLPLPFSLRLDSFRVQCYPGTDAPQDYISYIRLSDSSGGEQMATVSMNRILTHRGYRFYQSSYDPDGRGSWLSVNHDPWGIGVTYAGYALLGLSMLGVLFSRGGEFRRLLRHPLLRKGGFLTVFLLLGAMAGQAQGRKLPVLKQRQADSLAAVQVIYHDRVVPFNTLARDFVLKLTGRPTYKGLTPERVVGGWLLHPEVWKDEPMIRIKSADLRRRLGVEGDFARLSDLFDGQTYRLLQQARAALVTSGTATLETALFRVPQVVCYHTPIGRVIAFLKRHILKVKYISLVNLIAGREVVRELVADTMTVAQIKTELGRILNDESWRREMLAGYDEVSKRLGEPGAPAKAARLIRSLLAKG